MKETRNSKRLPDTLKLICRALDDKKAENLRVLDVSAQSSITDFIVLATGTSEPHLRAMRVELEKVLDAAKIHIVGMDTAQASGWLVVDAFDVMVHFFTTEKREHYQLESLWKDAVEISVPSLLTEPAKAKPAAKKKTPTAKKAPKVAGRKTASKAKKK